MLSLVVTRCVKWENWLTGAYPDSVATLTLVEVSKIRCVSSSGWP